jgi:hypothetical protein
MKAVILHAAKACRKPVGVIALVDNRVLAFWERRRAFSLPFVVVHLPVAQKQDERSTMPSQTACSLEFNPPLVRPIRRGTSPFLADWLRCGGLSSG